MRVDEWPCEGYVMAQAGCPTCDQVDEGVGIDTHGELFCLVCLVTLELEDVNLCPETFERGYTPFDTCPLCDTPIPDAVRYPS